MPVGPAGLTAYRVAGQAADGSGPTAAAASTSTVHWQNEGPEMFCSQLLKYPAGEYEPSDVFGYSEARLGLDDEVTQGLSRVISRSWTICLYRG